jgi:hypothetical protein
MQFVCTCIVWKLIYKANFTCTNMYTRQTLVSPLHVTARHGCHHQVVRPVANVNNKIDNKGADEQQIQKAGEWMN